MSDSATPAAAAAAAPVAAGSSAEKAYYQSRYAEYLAYGAPQAEISDFTNSSAMMIAYERGLETRRPDALFHDPFAEKLAGSQGKKLSDKFGGNCTMFLLPDWPAFHKTWTAVRTKFIDDAIAKHAATGRFKQIVNVGAGMDTRAYRLKSYKAFTIGSFEVDMEVINANKEKVFRHFLGSPTPYCNAVHNISLNLLDTKTTLATELAKVASFAQSEPSIFYSEGVVMYLGALGKLKLIKDISEVAKTGSVLILNFMEDPTGVNADQALSAAEAREALGANGWGEPVVSRFGDESLNFGRFPTDRFGPQVSFSFLVCKKK